VIPIKELNLLVGDEKCLREKYQIKTMDDETYELLIEKS
jgi:hypothetical protein